MAAAEAPTQHTLQLFDVLEQLPRDVLRDSVWLHLTDDSLQAPIALEAPCPGTHLGRAFRLACPRSLRLADQLTQRLHLICHTADPDFDEDDAVESHGAFLARQKGLRELTLTDDSDYGDNLVIKTLLLGGATCRHLKRLCIHTRCAWTAAAAQAVRQLCPNLGELDITARTLDAAVFSRLRHLRGLTKVSICCKKESEDCGDVIAALAKLPSLRRLTLAGGLAAEAVDDLARLTGLEELCARSLLVASDVDGPRLGRALGRLTRLTKLGVPDVKEFGDQTDNDLQMMQGVAKQLGGLTRLASLSFGRRQAECPPMDAGFDVVRHLSSLTSLVCPPAGDALSASTGDGGGSLPLLCNLEILGIVTSSELAAMLGKLRPLSQLRQLACTLRLAEDGRDDNDGGRAAAGQAASLLTQAPSLERITLAIAGYSEEYQLLASPAIVLMAPLGDRLVALLFTSVGYGVLDALWFTMCQIPCLELLSLVECSVPVAWLRSVVGEHAPALRRLGVSGLCKASACAIRLAEVRVQPLSIMWLLPELKAERYQQFRSAARVGVTVCGTDQNMGACDYA